MTRVRYDRERMRLEMQGHAGAGEHGADLTCAALSMLMMALERRMQERAEKRRPFIRRAPGFFMLACDPEEGEERLCRESFDTVAAGLAMLAENRGENVSFLLAGGDTDEEDEQ